MADTPHADPQALAESAPLLSQKKPRIASVDAFRGLTILLMIFVIRVAGYPDLPHTFPQFGSSPVSTWKHADAESAASWAFYEAGGQPTTSPAVRWRGAIVTATHPDRRVDLRLIQASTPAGTPNPASLRSKGSPWNPALDEALVTATRVLVNAPKPLRVGDGVIVHLPKGPDLWNETFATPADSAPPHTAIARFQAPKIGCTITDLVAPFFVFIVGVVIPFGSLHRNAGWFHHALRRCLFLIGAGILYLSLIGPLSLSWWWGILQAIGVAYLVGVLLYQFPALPRLGILLALALFHEVMTRQFHWWTELGDPNKVFFSVGNWRMNRDFDFLRPLELHCTPWASIGYGLCTVLGTFIGEAIKARHAIARTCLVVGISATVVGLILNSVGFPMHKEFVTTSYALFTSGIAALTYLGFYLVMDRAGYQTWAWPLEVFGQNALFAYFSQVLVGGILLERFGITAFFTGAPFDPSHPLAGAWWTSKAGYMGLAYGALYTFILWLATLYANRRGWYWKL